MSLIINGTSLEMLHLKWKDSTWVNESKSTNTYDGDNKLIGGLSQKCDGGDWVNGEKFTYSYLLVADIEKSKIKVNDFKLSQNYPNPFNPSRTINYSIKNQSFVTLKVFDVLGRELTSLVNKEQPQGNYSIEFDASGLTSGIYFYRIQAGQFVESKKMVLMK